MTFAEILLKCYDCGEPIGDGDLQVNGKKYEITGYFHPDCWDKYQLEHNMTVTISVIRNILWQDQAEWYIVCQDCYDKNRPHLWSGSTKVKDWPKQKRDVEEYSKEVKNCEFCKVKFGPFVRPQFPSKNNSQEFPNNSQKAEGSK